MATTRTRIRSWAAISLAVLAVGCDGDRSAQNARNDLPTLDVAALYETPPLTEVLKMGDIGVRAALREVIPGFRIVTSKEEDREIGEERVGLRFEVVEVLVGPSKPGDMITIESDGYQIDATSLERTAKLSVNGHSADDWVVGAEYVFFVATAVYGLQFRSPELVASVGEAGELHPIVSSFAPGFETVRTLVHVRALVEKALVEVQS